MDIKDGSCTAYVVAWFASRLNFSKFFSIIIKNLINPC